MLMQNLSFRFINLLLHLLIQTSLAFLMLLTYSLLMPIFLLYQLLTLLFRLFLLFLLLTPTFILLYTYLLLHANFLLLYNDVMPLSSFLNFRSILLNEDVYLLIVIFCISLQVLSYYHIA